MEVPVDDILSALTAEKGGAIRIELCSALSEGGLTPTVGFLKCCKKILKIPVFVMIRPRGGDFVYHKNDMEIMIEDLKMLKANGADGFVFGVLNENNNLDEEKCKILIDNASPKPCTLHRSFDETRNCEEALETAIKLGFSRILTSGKQPDALKGINTLTTLVNKARERIIIMPGGGVNCSNLEEILQRTKAKEFHGSVKEKLLLNGHYRYLTDENNVLKMINIYEKVYNS